MHKSFLLSYGDVGQCCRETMLTFLINMHMRKSGKFIIKESVQQGIANAGITDIEKRADDSVLEVDYMKVINKIIKRYGREIDDNWWCMKPGIIRNTDNYTDFEELKNPGKYAFALSDADVDALDSCWSIKSQIQDINDYGKTHYGCKHDGLVIVNSLQVDRYVNRNSKYEFQMQLCVVRPNRNGNFTGNRRFASLSTTYVFSDYQAKNESKEKYKMLKGFFEHLIGYLREFYKISDERYLQLMYDEDAVSESIQVNLNNISAEEIEKKADEDVLVLDNPEAFLKFCSNTYKSEISDDFPKFTQIEEYKMRYPDNDHKKYKLYLFVYEYKSTKMHWSNQEKNVFLSIECTTKDEDIKITFDYEDTWGRTGLSSSNRLYTQEIQSGLEWHKRGFNAKNVSFIVSIAKNIIEYSDYIRERGDKWDEISKSPYDSLKCLFATNVWNDIVWKLSIMNESVNNGINQASVENMNDRADDFIDDETKNRRFYTKYHNELCNFITDIKGYTRKKLPKYPFKPEFKNGGYSGQRLHYTVEKTCTCRFSKRNVKEFDYEGKHYKCVTDWTKLLFHFDIYQSDIEYFCPEEPGDSLNSKHGILSNNFFIKMGPQQYPNNFIFWKSVIFKGDDFEFVENFENKTFRKEPNVNDELIRNYEKFIFALKETVKMLPGECYRRIGDLSSELQPISGEACCKVDHDAILDILEQYNFTKKLHMNFKKLGNM